MANIDFIEFKKRIQGGYKKIVIAAIITIVVVAVIIFPIPRYYKCNILLAPESGDADMNDKVSSIASSLGFSLGAGNSADAISPMLYPKLMESTSFLYSLADVKVKSKDGKINTTYYSYLDKCQNVAFYMKPIGYVSSKIKCLFNSDNQETSASIEKINPFVLTKKQTGVFKLMSSKISCNYDLKTGMIGLEIQDQDPLVAALMADSVCAKLQSYIIKYRTHKARIDLQYYQKLTSDAKREYEQARQKYGSFSDANMDVMLQSYKSKLEDLENDMQLKYNAYSQLCMQLQSAKAKVQERTPVFTIVQSSTVPIKPAGPKRMAILLTMLFIVEFLLILYLVKDLIWIRS